MKVANTLESAGYVVPSYTRADLLGAASPLNLRDIHDATLMVGADDSALPGVAGKGNPTTQGSAATQRERQAQMASAMPNFSVVAFVALLGLALWYKRS